MEEQKIDNNDQCKSEYHNEHLCCLLSTSWHLRNKEKFKEMVKDAQYECLMCHRTVKDGKNVCMPIEL
jgi:hypothetical protein